MSGEKYDRLCNIGVNMKISISPCMWGLWVWAGKSKAGFWHATIYSALEPV